MLKSSLRRQQYVFVDKLLADKSVSGRDSVSICIGGGFEEIAFFAELSFFVKAVCGGSAVEDGPCGAWNPFHRRVAAVVRSLISRIELGNARSIAAAPSRILFSGRRSARI